MFDWAKDNKDALALCVSVAALLISVWSTRVTVQRGSATSERIQDRAEAQSRRETLQRIHELLVEPEAAAGRRILFQASTSGEYPVLGTEEWDQVNYALALYDSLGGYVEHGHVDADEALALWHHPLTNIETPAREFMVRRRRHTSQGSYPWTYLDKLMVRAKSYQCRCDPYSGTDSASIATVSDAREIE